MLYSFQERFVPFVKDGSKRQTVRAYRKDGLLPKVGGMAHLYYGCRTKHCVKLLPPQTITEAKTIFLSDEGSAYLLNLQPKENALSMFPLTGLNRIKFAPHVMLFEYKDLFAWQDGFRPEGTTQDNPAGSFDLMLRFWKQTHQLPFAGTVTYW